MDAFARRELSSDVVFPAVAKLESDAAALRDERAEWLKEQSLVAHRPADVGAAWPDLTTEQRRGVIESVLTAVVVRPAGEPVRPGAGRGRVAMMAATRRQVSSDSGGALAS